ncbi:MAG: response regulator [Chloroflexi bacterium]|nr:response regulator [Chloroflexota bacterium]
MALVVDDEVDLNRFFVELLQDEGYQTVSARTGEEALRLAALCSPDVVLLDMVLPGKDGLEVARSLKADPDTARIPLLAISSTPEVITPSDAPLFAATIPKPFDLGALLLVLSRALGN